ncbi:interphotoreceptor matrix proteoglycan 1 [Ictalurus furcatus]|uniref:interphotoreceptor matrix proteoglycan 1 n=1 Tax=Ictalurus furcatus TaxID=66913 RepID=UPI002350A81F|nr:interphotoreceptor matrix proteoglycan 1 [Ictalurus furcatus]
MDWRVILAILCLIATSSADNSTSNSNSTNTSAVAATFNLVFSINETFVEEMANTSSPQFTAKATTIRNQLEPIYRQTFTNFIQMVILEFRNGSIVTNSTLEFTANGTIPTNSTVQDALVNATSTNSSLNIIPNSINVTQVPGL